MLKLLGIAKRARKISIGEDFTIKAIKNKEASLVFLANDAGVNTTKKVKEKCEFYNCELITSYSSEELSNAIGQKNRKVIGVCDQGFAKKMKEMK